MVERTLFGEEHEIFRQAVRRFMERDLAPHHEAWEEAGEVPRWAWKRAGEQGYLCAAIPAEYGGAGADRRYSIILMEEQARLNLTGLGFALHSDIVAPYIHHYGSEAQKQAWLPGMGSGDLIAAIAMTEPGGGSDLQAIRTSAVRDGDHYVISGQKTFITNGQTADLILVACKTDRSEGARGISLIMVEASRAGFERGRRLKKMGTKAQDTSELFFNEVRVPVSNLIGEEGKGFVYMMQELPWERMHVGIQAVSCCEAALEWTIDYTRNRKAFGKPVLDFQNTRFTLADCKTQVQVGRIFLDRCLELVLEGKLDTTTAAMVKLWTSDMQGKVLDELLQLHGGYGFMWEYPITRAFADARVQRIYAGTNEIMKELIGRTL
ncbi:acyl-CoA dehydrogenase family protein [uncultured Alsobacter sp.]|uniref:acyl-CoA dehydrogenase family protein n=1 Tax=uncultured Alsobacter sp. TaxID=1748258 RepID=UPI0025F6B517|nr:acyl-CoA dehydrogenase family protein [uncultured Alsobacter sp.]